MSSRKPICKCPNIRFAILLILIVFNVFAYTDSFGATQLSQFGITWTFNGDYQTGQFANGDYWVIGPVTIIGINPPSSSGGRVMNGSMINPSPATGQLQGYDSAMYANYGPSYSNSLNVALNVSSSNPLTIQPGNSLVSSISISAAGNRPQLYTCAILSVLDSAPPAGSFRPPYSGTDKRIKFNKSQLDYSILQSLQPVASTPSLSTVERDFERPWIDHVPAWTGRYCHPSANMPDYGREISTKAGVGALMLHLNFSNAQKEKLLIRYVQLGIDLFGIVQDGGTSNWECNGGHASGRKWPILFAGLVLGDGEMMNIGRVGVANYGHGHPDYIHFGEDDQTFYVSQTDINSGRYSSSDIGLPEWGIRHATDPSRDNKSWSADYRECCTANSWAGAVLSARIMNVRDLWNHDAFFDYQDRYMKTETDPYQRQASTFVTNMWDTYRDNITPPETDNTPPLAPTNLTSTNIGSTSISLSWTASQQASDGDLASGYRIYRDDVSVGTSNSTTYTDSGLTPETEYIYSVFSYDNANNQSQSAAEAIFTTIAGNGGPVIPPPSGDSYYISPNGNNSNSGTDWNQALRNLPSTLQRGAVYYFAGGTYPDYTFDDTASGSEYITIQKATLTDHGVETGWTSAYANDLAVFGELIFSSTSYIFFDGISPAQTVVRYNNGQAGGDSVIRFDNSHHITIANTDIDGNFKSSGGSQTDGTCSNVGMNACSYITINNCKIHDAADDGLEITFSDNLAISNNEIYGLHGCGTDGGCGPCYNGHSDGFEIYNVTDSEFVGNFLHNIPSTSMFFFGNWATSTSDYCRNILIANNIFYNNIPTGFCAYIEQADNIRLENNVFWGKTNASYGGLSIGRFVTNLEMYNNIILSINFAHIGGSYNASQHRGDYNFFGYSTGQYQEQANDIVGTDPGFVAVNGANGPLISNISRDDFMLKDSSPCIDNGTNVNLEFDIAGNPRPIGNGFDIGAFEYGVAGPDNTPPQVSSVTPGKSYVDIRFSEAVEEVSASDVANYNINNGITINSATLNQQNNTVTLVTTPHESTTDYQITINNVKDLAGNVMAEVVFDYTFVQDIVGYWQFNEADGTSSQDLSPFDNTASLINGALLSGTGQVVFDGIDDALEVSMENMKASSGTIAVNVQQTDPAGTQYIFGHTIGTWSNRLQIYLDNGSLSIGLGDSHSTDVNIDQFMPGKWYLVALTWNGSEYIVYIDGLVKAAGSYSGLDSMNTFADFGNDGNSGLRDEALNGSIDEAMIYNYVLTAKQIAQLSGPIDINNYLVGHWNFIESTGETAADLSEYNNIGTLINGTAFSGNGEVILEGIDDAIEVSMANMEVNSGTIAIKAMQQDQAGSQYLFGHTIGTWSDRIQIYLENGSLSIGLGNLHATNVNIEQFVTGQWYLVALTWNGSEYNVYVDGTLKVSGSYSGLNAVGASADIGNTGNPDYRDQGFNGLISEAWIYSYTLTAEDIARLSGKGDEDTSLVGHWIFNKITGDSAADSSGYNNTATLINGAAFTGEGAVIFDGIDDAVEISMENMRTSAGTITLRVTPASYAGDINLLNYLFGHSAADWNDRIQLYLRQGTLTLGLGDNHELETNIYTLITGQKYHVALTWDTAAYSVYFDGIEITSGVYSGLNNLNTFADIGNNGNPGERNEAFEGLIEEVRIYNRKLTAEEIAELATGKKYGYEMLTLIMSNWLGNNPDADIAPPGGDGIVNLLDLYELSKHWDPQLPETP